MAFEWYCINANCMSALEVIFHLILEEIKWEHGDDEGGVVEK